MKMSPIEPEMQWIIPLAFVRSSRKETVDTCWRQFVCAKLLFASLRDGALIGKPLTGNGALTRKPSLLKGYGPS